MSQRLGRSYSKSTHQPENISSGNKIKDPLDEIRAWSFVFNVTLNNIAVIPWWSVLLVEQTGLPGENHRSVASHWLMKYVNVFNYCECDRSTIHDYIPEFHTVKYQCCDGKHCTTEGKSEKKISLPKSSIFLYTAIKCEISCKNLPPKFGINVSLHFFCRLSWLLDWWIDK